MKEQLTGMGSFRVKKLLQTALEENIWLSSNLLYIKPYKRIWINIKTWPQSHFAELIIPHMLSNPIYKSLKKQMKLYTQWQAKGKSNDIYTAFILWLYFADKATVIQIPLRMKQEKNNLMKWMHFEKVRACNVQYK